MKIPTFIKWPGGKRRLITQIIPYLPDRVTRYFEPFLGGGAMFFYIKQRYNPKFCVLSDINKDLIEAFKTVRDNPMELIKILRNFEKKDSKDFYYSLRKSFNKGNIQGLKRSAAFIYFTKTCFNGVYRVNKKGEFNVPYGYHKSNKILDKENILLAHRLLQGVIIKVQDYTEISNNINKGDLVYLDPCYDPIKRTSFVHYTPERFSITDRKKLFKFVRSINRKGANILLSNNNIKEVRELYRRAGFKINRVRATRCVNVDINNRGCVVELLIKN
jgi:DNA adenine methylase